jgi:hypothetical protein
MGKLQAKIGTRTARNPSPRHGMQRRVQSADSGEKPAMARFSLRVRNDVFSSEAQSASRSAASA